MPPPPMSTLFPYTTLFRSDCMMAPIPCFIRNTESWRNGRTLSPSAENTSTPGTSTEEAVDRLRSRLRSEEHTSELQSQSNLVCRLLLEKKKNNAPHSTTTA